MKPSDKGEFAKVVIGFAELKGRQLTLGAIELYWAALQDWSIDDFKHAAAHLLRTAQYMPTPRDFELLRKAGRPTAGESWAQAVAACGSCHSGGYFGPGGSCGNPFVDRVVRAIGGYRAIAMCDSEKLPFLERRFAEHFDVMQDAEDVREELPQIAGPEAARQLTDGRER